MAKVSEGDDLNFSPEEANKLKKAFQNEEFLKLFKEYAEDIRSPESRLLFEKEITALEKGRGFDVKFIHPDPLYVMKFITNGSKFFINICQNQFVKEPIYERKNSGYEWQIPVILSKPREDFDKRNKRCTVIDVMFHPKTIGLSRQNKRIRQVVEDTALSTVREQFKYSDLKDQKYPKLKYKGTPPPLILRQNKEEGIVCEPIEQYWKKLLKESKAAEKNPPKSSTAQVSVVPQHSIKYRNIVDMKDFSLMGYTDNVAPKAILVEVNLPKVEKASEVDLEISHRSLTLKSNSEEMHNYILELQLSYAVDRDSSTAKFDTVSKILNVTLPVKERGLPKLSDPM